MTKITAFIKFVIVFMLICSLLNIFYAIAAVKSILTAFTAAKLIGELIAACAIGYFLFLRKRRYKKISLNPLI